MRNGLILRIIALVTCVLACAESLSAATQFRFKTWNTENGLPQNSVNSIVQTPDGYIWIATFDGLARFDGVRFTVFKKSNTPELPMNRINNLVVDAAGRMWIYTEDPTTIVVYENRKFRAFYKGIHFETDNIYEPWGDRKEIRLPYGHDDYLFDGDKFALRTGGRPDTISKVWYDDTRRSWIDMGDSYTIADENKSTIYQKTGRLPIKERNLKFTTAVEAGGALWFFVPTGPDLFGLFRFRDGRLKLSSISTQGTRFLQKDLSGSLWIGHYFDGVDVIDAASLVNSDPSDLKPEHISTNNGLADIGAMSMLQDRNGNIWLGTRKGLQLLMDEPIVNYYSRKTGLPSENIYAIVEDRSGAIWFGAWDNHLIKYQNKKFTVEPVRFVTSLFVDRDARLWVGQNQVLWYRENGKWISPLLGSELDPMKLDDFSVISQDHGGSIWVGTQGGILQLDDKRGIRMFTTADGLPGNAVTSFLETAEGEIWVGTVNGLARFQNDRFVSFTTQDGLAGNFIRSIYQDREGVLWIGTYDSGLTRYKNGKFATISSADGLFNDGVFCILEDDDRWFWMNSNQGIYRVRRDELNQFADRQVRSVTSISYGPEDGLLNVEGNGGKQPSGIRSSDGKLWFPTAGGLAVVDPRKVERPSGPPPVLLEDVMVDQDAVRPNDGAVRVQPGQLALSIAYTAFDFRHADRLRFRYRLEGLDENWTEAGSRRTAYFSHLPYGEYTFRVIAATSDGIWNNEGATLKIVVVPPFYRTTWFSALVIAGVLLVTGGVYFYRMRQLRAISDARSQFARQLIDSQESERRRIALELHDSLGQSLAIIRNRALLSLSTPERHERLVEQMREISEASAAALQEAREIAHNLHPAQIEHLGLPAALRSLIESFERGTAIEFKAKIDDRAHHISRDQAINLYRIAQESLSNVVKHSGATVAEVELAQTDHGLTLNINDNGCGFSAGEPQAGLGLRNIRERADIIGAEFQIRSDNGNGTRITVSLPLNFEENGRSN